MPTRKNKKYRKVVKLATSDMAAAADQSVTIHTVTDPGTTKRIIIDMSMGQDAQAADNRTFWGLCITKPGETLPAIADMESQENRWLAIGGGLAVAQSDQGGMKVYRDMKIQRKVKDGDVISLVTNTTTVGRQDGTITVFIDET